MTSLRRDLIWVLQNAVPAWVQLSSVPLHQKGRSRFGPNVHVLKALLAGHKSFPLARSCCGLAPQSPSNLLLQERTLLVVGQTAKGMERPRLRLLRVLESSSLRQLNLLSSNRCGCSQEQVSHNVSCLSWGQHKYILCEIEVDSPPHHSFLFLPWRLDIFCISYFPWF